MKRLLTLFIVLALALSLAACGASGKPESVQPESGKPAEGETAEPVNIIFVIGGYLGDGQTTDTVYAAVDDVVKANGGTLTVAECSEAALFEQYVMDAAASGEYDLIIAPFYSFVEPVSLAAKAYPDQKFIGYDAEYDYADGKNANVASFRGRSCEGGFIEGIIAALLTSSGVEGTNPEKVVGFVGGGENPAIQDFLFGFIDGVNYVDSSIDVKYAFVGNWEDIAVGKELGMSQIQAGADVIYTTCATASYGTADALVEMGGYCLGCGGDFAAITAEAQPEISRIFISSDMNTYDKIIADAVQQFIDGKLEFGKYTEVGWGDGAVGWYTNDTFKQIFNADLQAKFDEITDKLAAGEITVSSAIGATQEEIDAKKAEAAPF